MKLFVATIALAKAQDAGDESRTFSFGDSAYDFGDSAYDFGASNFYDSAYGNDYASLSANYNYDDAAADAAAADASVADEAGRDKEEARYFGGAVATTTTTTPGTPPTTTTHETDVYCIKCDVMNPAECVATGKDTEKCAHGDVCFLEVRRNNPRTGNALTQICTGCKSPQACYDLKAQNMVASSTTPRGLLQCFPTTNLLNTGHRLGEMASVCRTCFIPSDAIKDSDTNTHTDADKKRFFWADATKYYIPQAGDGTTANAEYTLYSEDVAPGTTEFVKAWFSEPHGLSLAVHGINFSITNYSS